MSGIASALAVGLMAFGIIYSERLQLNERWHIAIVCAFIIIAYGAGVLRGTIMEIERNGHVGL